jgi:uncharacterized BrkB/YihY/UPF0761 family membrane protein
VYQKSTDDNIFFMAGAISYNLLIAVVPLFLLAVGLWGYVLRARYGEPSEVIVGLLSTLRIALRQVFDIAGDRGVFVAATVMAVSYELMKWGFGWYVTSVADYRSAYGNLATIVVLLFWIYYGSVVFVLSGEVAQVYTMRTVRKVQIRAAFGGSA